MEPKARNHPNPSWPRDAAMTNAGKIRVIRCCSRLRVKPLFPYGRAFKAASTPGRNTARSGSPPAVVVT